MKPAAPNRGTGGRARGLLNWTILAFSALTILFLAATLGTGHSIAATAAESGRTHVVEIRQFKYIPATLEIKRGDTVVFKNLDAAPHTATAKGWDSGMLKRNQSWSMKYSRAGTFDYLCTYHPAMKGKLVVK